MYMCINVYMLSPSPFQAVDPSDPACASIACPPKRVGDDPQAVRIADVLSVETLSKESIMTTQHTSLTADIARLNDLCRTAPGIGGQWFITPGIQALPEAQQSAIRESIERFSDFTSDNDPYGERDFGAFTHLGQRIFWKIDCYALDMQHGSENPADPKQTRRVLTIMLAEEY